MKRVQALQPLGRDQPFRWQWMLMYICTTTGRSLARFSLVIAWRDFRANVVVLAIDSGQPVET